MTSTDMEELPVLPGDAWTGSAGGQRNETGPGAADVSHLQPIDWTAFWSRDEPEMEWVAEPILPAGRQVAIYAPAKAGKSLLSLELAAGIATGRAVLAQEGGPPTSVVYIDQEMTPADLRERLDAFGYGPDDDLTHLHYYQLAGFPPFDTAPGGLELLGVCQRDRAKVVILDTMASALAGQENDSDTYRSFYRFTGRDLKAEGISLLRLDHAGKEVDRGQRGSSGKADDVDVVFRLTVDGPTVTLRRTHSRVPWVPETVTLDRLDEPLRHHLSPNAWPAGTAETAADLDTHDVPLDTTLANATAALKRHGQGRRKTVVAAAVKYRRARP